MATTDQDFTANTCVEPDDFTGFKEEPNIAIQTSGQELNVIDRSQLSKALAEYAARGAAYIEDGTSASNVYVLKPTLNVPDPPIAVSAMSRTGREVSVTTAAPNGFIDSDIVFVDGVDQSDYNGEFGIFDLVGANFKYTLKSFNIVSIVRVAATATITLLVNHGYSNGEIVGQLFWDQPEYNGVFTIFGVTPTTYQITIVGTPVTPGTGNGDVVRLQDQPTGSITVSRTVLPMASILKYTDKLKLRFRVVNPNTLASTVTVLGLGTKPLLKNGSALDPGDLGLNNCVDIIFNQSLDAFELGFSISFAPIANLNTRPGYRNNDGEAEFKVSERTVPDLFVVINDVEPSGGVFLGSDGIIFTKSVGTDTELELGAADLTDPRWDLISLRAGTGIYTITVGTAAPVPQQPAIPTDEDGLAYIFREANSTVIRDFDILDIRQASGIRNTDGHFATNFSIEQKEDSEQTLGNQAQFFQRIDFGTRFDTVQPNKTKLHVIENIVVPVDDASTVEPIFTGTWVRSTDNDGFFGIIMSSSIIGSQLTLEFFGHSLAVALREIAPGGGGVFIELSTDGGATYGDGRTVNVFADGTANFVQYDVYSGLPLRTYFFRLTLLFGAVQVSDLQYGTKMIQMPTNIYGLAAVGGPQSIDEVPPGVTFLNGSGWTINNNETAFWNSIEVTTTGDGDTAEFKFYGKICWAIFGLDTSNPVISIEIDGSTTNVRSPSFSPIDLESQTGHPWAYYRLDDGGLDEGIHVIKVTRVSGTGAQSLIIPQFGFYGDKTPTTASRSLITGKKSFFVGVDDPAFTLTGSWSGPQDSATSLIRRQATTSSANDFAEITTPNDPDLAAIHVVYGMKGSGAELELTIGGLVPLFLTTNLDNGVDQNSFISLVHDSFFHGDLQNKVFRIENNNGADMFLEGVIFQFKDSVETDHITVMPRWTRFNNTQDDDTVVACIHRLDVFGSKTDNSIGRQPSGHSGWLTPNSTVFMRHGLGFVEGLKITAYGTNPGAVQTNTINDAFFELGPNNTNANPQWIFPYSSSSGSGQVGDLGQLFLNYDDTVITKLILTWNRVI